MDLLFKTKGSALVGVLVAVVVIAALVYGSSFFWGKNTNYLSDANNTNIIGEYEQAKDDIARINQNTETKQQAINEASEISGSITIDGILAGDTLVSPVTVSGTADVAENMLAVELRNLAGEALVSEPVSVKDSEFSVTLNFAFASTKEGFLAVYEPSPDSSRLNIVKIPVKYGNAGN